MTKKEMFAEIINLANANDRMDIVEFAQKEIDLIEKRANTETKARQAKKDENNDLKIRIVNLLSVASTMWRAGELAKNLDLSPQKVTFLLQELKREGKIEKTIVKRVAFYTIINKDDMEEE